MTGNIKLRAGTKIVAAVLLLWVTAPVTAVLAQQGPVAEGDVVKVDLSPGIITVRHGPIPNLGMTSSTATDDFKVGDAIMLNALQPGLHIKFTADRVNGQLTITALKP
jgi:Cu/Ag efflux protein CusF